MYERRKSEIIRSIPKLKALAKKMRELEVFAFDTETNTLRVYADNEHFSLVGISISWGRDNNYYIPTGHYFEIDQLEVSDVVTYLKPIFENKNVTIVGANIKFDMHVMQRIGIHIQTPHLIDTMVLSWLSDENADKGLKQCTQRLLNVSQEKFGNVLSTVSPEQKRLVGLKANNTPTYDLVSIENGSPYALDDAYFTFEIYNILYQELASQGLLHIYKKVYPQAIRTFFNMEERGICIDVNRLEQMRIDMEEDLEELTYDMLELAEVPLELGSNQQLCQLLFGFNDYKNVDINILEANFGFEPISYTGTGKPQVNSSVIETLSKVKATDARMMQGVQFCNKLLEFKKLMKLKSAFVDGLLAQTYDDNKAHPSFNVVGTTSGRVSCSSPNLMQLPNANEDDKYQIRDVFVGQDGKHIISVDFSNLEVRVLAHFSQDDNLINAFLANKDLHGNTAKMMFRLDCDANDVKHLYPELRTQGKVIAFLLNYGGSANTLYETLNRNGELDALSKKHKNNKESDFYRCTNGQKVAQRLLDLYFQGFPKVTEFMRTQKKLVHRQTYVHTLIGRKRRLPEITSSNRGMVGYAERLSVNACIQGSGADIMLNAQNRVEGTTPTYMSQDYLDTHDLEQNFIASERLKELECQMLVQIHDELLFECPEENCEEAIGIIRDCMINPFGDKVKLNVPLEVGADHGISYACGH